MFYPETTQYCFAAWRTNLAQAIREQRPDKLAFFTNNLKTQC
ncbi:hypothetical protein VCHE46_0418 [Vibrio cholerae HE-46]|nr:hypothetical protein VCHE46_0418 [Vibrio cholerae HE-46]